jgi:ANTAR domain
VDSSVPHSVYARLEARLDTLPVIEQAKGIVMAREGCGPEEAFNLLRRASRRANLKVHVLAAFLVEQASGNPAAKLPGSTPPRPAPRSGSSCRTTTCATASSAPA